MDFDCKSIFYLVFFPSKWCREETENGLKDPIMYHTCDRAKRGDLPYFPMGSFNCHDAGIDITFENPDRQYRASFLIRGYRVEALLGRTWVFGSGDSLRYGDCLRWLKNALAKLVRAEYL